MDADDGQGRPKALYAQYQEQRMVVVSLRRCNQADGVETPEEEHAELIELRKLEIVGAQEACTDEAIAAALCGRDGIRSKNFLLLIASELPDKVTRFRKRPAPAWPREAA